MTTTIVAEADPDGPGEALEDEGTMIVRVASIASTGPLSEAGIEDADLLVPADMDNATIIAVTKEQNPGVRVVTYVYDTLPESARGQADLAIDPNLLAVGVIAEEPI